MGVEQLLQGTFEVGKPCQKLIGLWLVTKLFLQAEFALDQVNRTVGVSRKRRKLLKQFLNQNGMSAVPAGLLILADDGQQLSCG